MKYIKMKKLFWLNLLTMILMNLSYASFPHGLGQGDIGGGADLPTIKGAFPGAVRIPLREEMCARLEQQMAEVKDVDLPQGLQTIKTMFSTIGAVSTQSTQDVPTPMETPQTTPTVDKPKAVKAATQFPFDISRIEARMAAQLAQAGESFADVCDTSARAQIARAREMLEGTDDTSAREELAAARQIFDITEEARAAADSRADAETDPLLHARVLERQTRRAVAKRGLIGARQGQAAVFAAQQMRQYQQIRPSLRAAAARATARAQQFPQGGLESMFAAMTAMQESLDQDLSGIMATSSSPKPSESDSDSSTDCEDPAVSLIMQAADDYIFNKLDQGEEALSEALAALQRLRENSKVIDYLTQIIGTSIEAIEVFTPYYWGLWALEKVGAIEGVHNYLTKTFTTIGLRKSGSKLATLAITALEMRAGGSGKHGTGKGKPITTKAKAGSDAVPPSAASTLYERLLDASVFKRIMVEWQAPGGRSGTGYTYRVRQRTDIEWDMVRTGAKYQPKLTNRQAALQGGYAPILRSDGKPVNLHHIGQDALGPLLEISATTHSKGMKALHSLHGPSTQAHPTRAVDHGTFGKDRMAYWKWRAQHAQ